MKTLGIDIGTTTICAVVLENRTVTATRTLKNGYFIPTPNAYEKIQDVSAIRTSALSAVDELLTEFPDIDAIGVTGQMHGILYLDKNGNPLSELFTWQDGRGDLEFRDRLSYAAYLTKLTGYPTASGYGIVTHFYNLKNALVPESAVKFCTIHDYIAMLLCGNTTPFTDAGDAASLGLFDVKQGGFDRSALNMAGIDESFLPEIPSEPLIGYYKGKIPVFNAMGDNQASFLGAVGGNTAAMLVNVGTGSQFSVFTENYMACPGLETRPFPGGGYLLVGAQLCGGRAYALLEKFFRDSVCMVTGESPTDCYGAMSTLLESSELPDNLPEVVPLFQGTRADPTLRGEIRGLSVENFTPLHLILGLMEGMASELHEMYLRYRESGGKTCTLIGSGNGLRRNPHLCTCFERIFEVPLRLSEFTEEAACGAAMYAENQL